MLNINTKDYLYENNEDVKVLMDFIRKPLETTNEIFDIFKTLPNSIYREYKSISQERFVYIEGTRPDKVLLVAHADTVWDGNRYSPKRNSKHNPQIINGVIESTSDVGIGADDRSGVAILWLLKDMGHSLLIVDGEERGMVGSSWLVNHNEDIAEKINNEHSFVVQFDRKGSSDFKCYSVGSDEFREYLKTETLYSEPERFSFTDICTLCYKVVGVNLSVGYYNEHTSREILVIKEWINTLNMVRNWLSKPNLPRFEINNKEENWNMYDKFKFYSDTFKNSVDDIDYDLDFDGTIISSHKKITSSKSSYRSNKNKKYSLDDLDDYMSYVYEEDDIEELEDVLVMFQDVPLNEIDDYKGFLSDEVFNFVKKSLIKKSRVI